jgi:uncharacterized protein (TIGR02757 family)
MNQRAIDEFLIAKALQFESLAFIKDDPICIPHRFTLKEDIEITSLLVSTIAWGNRKAIIKSGENLVNIMGESPYDFVMNYNSSREFRFVHRTFSGVDLSFFFSGLKSIYAQQGGLETAFKKETGQSIAYAIANFRKAMLNAPHEARSRKHLSDPFSNSACKRLNMFLRWMVRSNKNGVDFGLWKVLSPTELHVPLDVHTGNIARKLGILTRKQNDWKSSELLHEYSAKLLPHDPAAIDFALFGLGAIEKF